MATNVIPGQLGIASWDLYAKSASALDATLADYKALGADWLRIDIGPDAAGRLPGFTLTPHTAEEVDRAAHPHELPPSTATRLYLDAAQHGLGSRACGPDVWPAQALAPRAASLRLRFAPG